MNKKKYILLIMLILVGCSLYGCRTNKENSMKPVEGATQEAQVTEEVKSPEEEDEQWEKGYELPVDESESEEAENECRSMMELIASMYENADKGDTSNVILKDELIFNMQEEIKKTGKPVTTIVNYSNMDNYEQVDSFLMDCRAGNSGNIAVFCVYNDGGVGRTKFTYDGTDMYVISARAVWNDDNKPGMSYIQNNRIKEWKYTDKGWFCYEICVPESPEVSELVNGSCVLRVKPMTEEQQTLSRKCVGGLGYCGNNILCSDWDTEHMEKLDYNGMYEYLYEMKNHEKFNAEKYQGGIPKEEFESLIMEYLPVTKEQIRKYAAFDKKKQTYYWEKLGCPNYAPTYFGTSIPEVTDVKENKDGPTTLTVDAVCSMVICDDAVITHELTVRLLKGGRMQYLGNKILNNGIENIPEYQYRIKEW